jgi:hypothetical protein
VRLDWERAADKMRRRGTVDGQRVTQQRFNRRCRFLPLNCRYRKRSGERSYLSAARAGAFCRVITAFASRIARPSSPVRSNDSFATLAQSSFSSGVVALCVCLSASFEVHGILIRLRFQGNRMSLTRQSYVGSYCEPTALGLLARVGRWANSKGTARRPCASQASTSNSALSALRHRSSSSRHLARTDTR